MALGVLSAIFKYLDIMENGGNFHGHVDQGQLNSLFLGGDGAGAGVQ